MRRELRTDGPDSHRLLIWLGDVEHQMDDLRAENTRLREALTPFAAMADAYDPPEDDDHEIVWDRKPTLGQLRAARAAVERQHAAALAEKDKEIADLKKAIVFQVKLGEHGRNSTIAVNGQRLDCVESLAITSSVDGLMRVTLTLIGVSVEGWTPPQPVAAPQEEP